LKVKKNNCFLLYTVLYLKFYCMSVLSLSARRSWREREGERGEISRDQQRERERERESSFPGISRVSTCRSRSPLNSWLYSASFGGHENNRCIYWEKERNRTTCR